MSELKGKKFKAPVRNAFPINSQCIDKENGSTGGIGKSLKKNQSTKSGYEKNVGSKVEHSFDKVSQSSSNSSRSRAWGSHIVNKEINSPENGSTLKLNLVMNSSSDESDKAMSLDQDDFKDSENFCKLTPKKNSEKIKTKGRSPFLTPNLKKVQDSPNTQSSAASSRCKSPWGSHIVKSRNKTPVLETKIKKKHSLSGEIITNDEAKKDAEESCVSSDLSFCGVSSKKPVTSVKSNRKGIRERMEHPTKKSKLILKKKWRDYDSDGSVSSSRSSTAWGSHIVKTNKGLSNSKILSEEFGHRKKSPRENSKSKNKSDEKEKLKESPQKNTTSEADVVGSSKTTKHEWVTVTKRTRHNSLEDPILTRESQNLQNTIENHHTDICRPVKMDSGFEDDENLEIKNKNTVLSKPDTQFTGYGNDENMENKSQNTVISLATTSANNTILHSTERGHHARKKSTSQSLQLENDPDFQMKKHSSPENILEHKSKGAEIIPSSQGNKAKSQVGKITCTGKTDVEFSEVITSLIDSLEPLKSVQESAIIKKKGFPGRPKVLSKQKPSGSRPKSSRKKSCGETSKRLLFNPSRQNDISLVKEEKEVRKESNLPGNDPTPAGSDLECLGDKSVAMSCGSTSSEKQASQGSESFRKDNTSKAVAKSNDRISISQRSPFHSQTRILLSQDSRTIHSPPSGLSQRDRIKWLHKNCIFGLWVQCSSCSNWRYVDKYQDPLIVPESWYCHMNRDTRYNKCEQETSPNFCEESLIDNKFTCGSLVLAQLDGYPPWPGMVDDDPEFALYYWLGSSSKPTHYHVTFFDSKKVTRSWIHVSCIKPFTDPLNSEGESSSLVAKYYERLKVASNQAIEASNMSLGSRLRKFSFVVRHKGPIYSYKRGLSNSIKENNLEPHNESNSTDPDLELNLLKKMTKQIQVIKKKLDKKPKRKLNKSPRKKLQKTMLRVLYSSQDSKNSSS